MRKNISILFLLFFILAYTIKAEANVYVYETPYSGSAIINTNTNVNTNRIVTYSPNTRIISGNYNVSYPSYGYYPQTRHHYNPYGEHIVGYDYDADGRVKAIRTITNYNPPIYRPMYHQGPPQYNHGFGIPNYMGMPHNMPQVNNMQSGTATFNWKL